MSGTVLDSIVADVRAARAMRPTRCRVATPDPARRRRFVDALTEPGLSVIAELKRRSPSAGRIAIDDDLLGHARAYAAGGASALSVLTEPKHFGGAREDLPAVRGVGLPRLRKDFLLEVDDIDESFALGADAVLLITAVLDDEHLRRMRDRADELGLAVLAEAHAERELERALAIEPDALGLNARDLETFEVDLARVERLLPRIPDSTVRVAESGVRTGLDARRVRAAGADAVLVGEALMRTDDPAALVAELKRCGHDAR